MTDAESFVNGWVVGYIEGGGSFGDPELPAKAIKAYERRQSADGLPAHVSIPLDKAIAAVKKSQQGARSGVRERVTVHICGDCGHVEGESPQGGCCPKCGRRSEPIPAEYARAG